MSNAKKKGSYLSPIVFHIDLLLATTLYVSVSKRKSVILFQLGPRFHTFAEKNGMFFSKMYVPVKFISQVDTFTEQSRNLSRGIFQVEIISFANM